MPKQATCFYFIEEQTICIKSFYSDIEDLVCDYDPQHKGKCKPLKKWKRDTAQMLLEEPLFADLDPSETQAEWHKAIVRVWTNYYNSHIKSKEKFEPTAKLNLKTGTSGSNSPPALILFTGSVSSKALFTLKNHTEITTLYKRICKEKGIAGGPAKFEATSQLWEQADQDEWVKKAKALANNTNGNRAEFPILILESMQQMIDKDALGSCVLSLSYAFHNEDNEVIGGQVQTGYNSNSGQSIEQEYDEGKDACKPLELATRMLKNDNGLPLFPIFNQKTKTCTEIAQILDDYFHAVWAHTQDGSLIIPWAEISTKPDTYYVSWIHTFPGKLGAPDDMDEIHIMQVASYLASKPIYEPFTFYPKSQVLDNLKLSENLCNHQSNIAPSPASSESTNDLADINHNNDNVLPLPPLQDNHVYANATVPSHALHPPQPIITADCGPGLVLMGPAAPVPPVSPALEVPLAVDVNQSSAVMTSSKLLLDAMRGSNNSGANPVLGVEKPQGKKRKAGTTMHLTQASACCGERNCKLVSHGATLTRDPTLPPPKRVK